MFRQYFSVKISFVNILWKTETYNAKIFCRINKKIETNEFFYRHLLHQLVNSIEKFRALFQKFSVKIWDDKKFLSTRLTKKCTFSSSGLLYYYLWKQNKKSLMVFMCNFHKMGHWFWIGLFILYISACHCNP